MTPPDMFRADDWYWTVDNDTSQVYSTSKNKFVPADDPDYVAWKATGNKTYETDSLGLGQYLSGIDGKSSVSFRPLGLGTLGNKVLDSYQNTKADEIARERLSIILLDHENRIQALEDRPGPPTDPGAPTTVVRPPLTLRQFRDKIKKML